MARADARRGSAGTGASASSSAAWPARLNPQCGGDHRSTSTPSSGADRLAASPAPLARVRGACSMEIDISRCCPRSACRRSSCTKDRTCVHRRATVAAAIPGAELIVVPGVGFAIWENDLPLEAIARSWPAERPRTCPIRCSTTVLFTDLVGSTERAASSATEPGASCSSGTTLTFAAGARALSAARRWTRPATASSPFRRARAGDRLCAGRIVERRRELGLEVRGGIHTGECELVGRQDRGSSPSSRRRADVRLWQPARARCSSPERSKDLVAGSGFSFEERGEHELKGVPGSWRLYAVADG